MKVFPINQQKSVFRTNEKVKSNIFILLPSDWWNTETSYFSTVKNKISNKSKNPQLYNGNIKKSHKNWNVNQGDYFVRGTRKQKDLAYYRELKEKYLKLLIVPFIILASYLVYITSIFLSKITI